MLITEVNTKSKMAAIAVLFASDNIVKSARLSTLRCEQQAQILHYCITVVPQLALFRPAQTELRMGKYNSPLIFNDKPPTLFVAAY